jgi:hypothetical protein
VNLKNPKTNKRIIRMTQQMFLMVLLAIATQACR